MVGEADRLASQGGAVPSWVEDQQTSRCEGGVGAWGGGGDREGEETVGRTKKQGLSDHL